MSKNVVGGGRKLTLVGLFCFLSSVTSIISADKEVKQTYRRYYTLVYDEKTDEEIKHFLEQNSKKEDYIYLFKTWNWRVYLHKNGKEILLKGDLEKRQFKHTYGLICPDDQLGLYGEISGEWDGDDKCIELSGKKIELYRIPFVIDKSSAKNYIQTEKFKKVLEYIENYKEGTPILTSKYIKKINEDLKGTIEGINDYSKFFSIYYKAKVETQELPLEERKLVIKIINPDNMRGVAKDNYLEKYYNIRLLIPDGAVLKESIRNSKHYNEIKEINFSYKKLTVKQLRAELSGYIKSLKDYGSDPEVYIYSESKKKLDNNIKLEKGNYFYVLNDSYMDKYKYECITYAREVLKDFKDKYDKANGNINELNKIIKEYQGKNKDKKIIKVRDEGYPEIKEIDNIIKKIKEDIAQNNKENDLKLAVKKTKEIEKKIIKKINKATRENIYTILDKYLEHYEKTTIPGKDIIKNFIRESLKKITEEKYDNREINEEVSKYNVDDLYNAVEKKMNEIKYNLVINFYNTPNCSVKSVTKDIKEYETLYGNITYDVFFEKIIDVLSRYRSYNTFIIYKKTNENEVDVTYSYDTIEPNSVLTIKFFSHEIFDGFCKKKRELDLEHMKKEEKKEDKKEPKKESEEKEKKDKELAEKGKKKKEVKKTNIQTQNKKGCSCCKSCSCKECKKGE